MLPRAWSKTGTCGSALPEVTAARPLLGRLCWWSVYSSTCRSSSCPLACSSSTCGMSDIWAARGQEPRAA